MSAIRITQALEKDISLIQDITADVWPQTYSKIISKEQIDFMLHEMYSTPALKYQFQQGHQFRIAWREEIAVGFCSFRKENEQNQFKLHKLYVRLNNQGKGAGTALVKEAIEAVKMQGGNHLILQVNRNNKNAIRFYQLHEFVIEKEVDLDIGNGFQMNDYIMALRF